LLDFPLNTAIRKVRRNEQQFSIDTVPLAGGRTTSPGKTILVTFIDNNDMAAVPSINNKTIVCMSDAFTLTRGHSCIYYGTNSTCTTIQRRN